MRWWFRINKAPPDSQSNAGEDGLLLIRVMFALIALTKGIALPVQSTPVPSPASPPTIGYVACGHGASNLSLVFVLHVTNPQTAERLKCEAAYAIECLKPFQRLNVIGTDRKGRVAVLWKDDSVVATPENKRIALKFVDAMGLTQNDTLLSMIEPAFLRKPDLAYLVTDANHLDSALPERVNESVGETRPKVSAILVINHCRRVEELLKETVASHRGKYRYLSRDNVD